MMCTLVSFLDHVCTGIWNGTAGNSLEMSDCWDVSLGLFLHLWYTILPTITTSTYTTYRAMNPA